MQNKTLLFLTFFIVLITGCVYNLQKEENGICYSEPEWALHLPVKKGKIYGVGVAPPNFNGESAQRRSAISKAIEEIAFQMNTQVDSILISKRSSYNQLGGFHSLKDISFQTTEGQKVTSKIIKMCKNPNNDFLYVLMEADKGKK